MPKFLMSVAAIVAIAALPMSAQAAPCKDAKGKFVKCPPAAAAKPAATAAKPSVPAKATPAKPAPAGKKAACRDAKGRFMKCK